MSDSSCELCGKPGFVHVTEIIGDVKRSRHFCREHAPAGTPLPSAADELSMVEQLIAQVEANEADPDRRAEALKELRELAKAIAAGRRRLTDSM